MVFSNQSLVVLSLTLCYSFVRQKVVDFLDLTLFNDLIYVNIALGMSFALYSDTAFFTLQPMYLFQLGFSKVYFLFVFFFLFI